MRFTRNPPRDSRNILFAASLEFGKNWMRPISDLAAERIGNEPSEVQETLSAEIESTRAGINEWIQQRWDSVNGKWRTPDTAAASSWVVASYPWMDKRNIKRAISQGCYYAHHG
ncbi:MAG: hypothetical protein F2667_05795 [Actinobacteria bacterium]|uniref:Unannotated protein n=1 Tax=freshwater metagenome TaxID=449393 RepID=A0A6J6Q868_9ZZZZ|nr:hypothetical protein [Actinomycetota bacterium]